MRSACGAKYMRTIPVARATAVTTARTLASLDTAHRRSAEEPRRPDEEHDQDHQERQRDPHPVEVEMGVRVVGDDEVQQHPDREAADDRADRAFEPSEYS